MSASKLMVLDRMIKFAMRNEGGVWRRWTVGLRWQLLRRGTWWGWAATLLLLSVISAQCSADFNSTEYLPRLPPHNTANGNNFVNLADKRLSLPSPPDPLQSI